MIDFGIVMDIAAVAAIVVSVIFAVLNVNNKSINKGLKERSDELDNAEGKLIDALKGQVDALDRKVADQAKMIDEMKRQMDILVQENTTLNKVLQGRDIETVESIKRTKEILDLSKQNTKSIEKLYKVIEKYLSQDKKR